MPRRAARTLDSPVPTVTRCSHGREPCRGQGEGSIKTDDIRRVLAFCALDMTAEQFEAALWKADSRNRDGSLDRAEFVDLCIDVLWGVPVEQLESAASNYAASVEALEARKNTYWRRVANEEAPRFNPTHHLKVRVMAERTLPAKEGVVNEQLVVHSCRLEVVVPAVGLALACTPRLRIMPVGMGQA